MEKQPFTKYKVTLKLFVYISESLKIRVLLTNFVLPQRGIRLLDEGDVAHLLWKHPCSVLGRLSLMAVAQAKCQRSIYPRLSMNPFHNQCQRL